MKCDFNLRNGTESLQNKIILILPDQNFKFKDMTFNRGGFEGKIPGATE